MLGLAAVLVMLAWPVAGAAGERGGKTDLDGALLPISFAGALAPDDEGFRLGVGPIALAKADGSLAGESWSIRSSTLGSEPRDAEPVAAWGLQDSPTALGFAALDPSNTVGDTAPDPASQQEHWSSLPFLGEEARRRGYTLPPPFGVSVAYNFVARDIEVTDVRVGVDGAAVHSVSHIASFKARSVVDAAVMKLDAWILPFLNAYALVGYIKNSSDVHVRVTVPRPGPAPGSREFTIKATTELEGFVVGGGLSLAAGYRQLFAMLDVNYTQTELGFDDRFRALIASGRVGWNGTVGPVPLRLWTGAAYWGTKNTARSTVEVPNVGSVRFEADQGPKHPWNAVVGVSGALHRHVELFAEYGFNFSDVTFFAGGLTFRF